jgi:predicted PurR-regulated permease PerM
MSLLAVMTTVGLWFLEIPSYLALGLIAGGLAFIPLLGPTLAFLPAILIASSQGAAAMLWVAGLYAGIQFLEGNFLTPLIQRKMTSIPPVLLITAQAIMGLLFGVFGVALAAPAAVVVMVLVNELYLKDNGDDSLQERTVAVVEETAL